MNRCDRFYTRRTKRQIFDIKDSDFDSKKEYSKKLKNGKIGDLKVEVDYKYFLEWVIENELTNVITSEDENENENEIVNEIEIEEDEDVDENDKDPQYCVFLENLTEHGKSYKLKISQNNNEACYLYYEEADSSDWIQTCIDNSGDDVSDDLQINQKVNEKKNAISTKQEVSRRKKITIQTHRGTIMDPDYKMYLPSEHVAVKTEENLEEYENIVVPSVSCSDIMILDNVQNCSQVNDEQLVLVEKEPSLREKLMHILEQPFDEKEYEERSEYIKEKKPICRLLDLRGRAISSALNGVRKSVLDDGPKIFQRMLKAAQNDPPKALNLLRMFFFWLQHVPNEDVFAPWEDEDILKVRPSENTNTMMLMDK